MTPTIPQVKIVLCTSIPLKEKSPTRDQTSDKTCTSINPPSTLNLSLAAGTKKHLKLHYSDIFSSREVMTGMVLQSNLDNITPSVSPESGEFCRGNGSLPSFLEVARIFQF
jgi:hypothetical protein